MQRLKNSKKSCQVIKIEILLLFILIFYFILFCFKNGGGGGGYVLDQLIVFYNDFSYKVINLKEIFV